jgi:hypothetical protein
VGSPRHRRAALDNLVSAAWLRHEPARHGAVALSQGINAGRSASGSDARSSCRRSARSGRSTRSGTASGSRGAAREPWDPADFSAAKRGAGRTGPGSALRRGGVVLRRRLPLVRHLAAGRGAETFRERAVADHKRLQGARPAFMIGRSDARAGWALHVLVRCPQSRAAPAPLGDVSYGPIA